MKLRATSFTVCELYIPLSSDLRKKNIPNIRIFSRTSLRIPKGEIRGHVWSQAQCQSQRVSPLQNEVSSLKTRTRCISFHDPAEAQSYIDEERASTTPFPLVSPARSRETGRSTSVQTDIPISLFENGFFPVYRTS